MKWLVQLKRNFPIIKKESLSTKYPIYGTALRNSEHLELNQLISNKNLMLKSFSNTYDNIDENGNLLSNNLQTGKKLYKHTVSIEIIMLFSDNEKGIIKKITINPISNGNYITDLYAPLGEIMIWNIRIWF